MHKSLTHEQRSFFSQIRNAVTANPFSRERTDIDLRITGLPRGTGTDERLGGMVREITAGFSTLEGGKADIRQYRGEDSLILRAAVLFVFFHLFLERFDHHIRAQIKAGDTPIKAGFADKAIEFLMQHGFDREMAVYYFALSFQLRRAFFFIDKNIKGQCPSMVRLKASLWNNVFTNSLEIYDAHLWNRMDDFSTLILGETGTGKGAVASAIGRSGYIPFDPETGRFKESFNRAFLSLNLSQYAEGLIESELFGHKKGAFTGAVHDREGIFDRASPHGAIFLDEIGEVSIPVQIKLLKVLEERTYFPVGGYEPRQFRGRIIAATNRSVEDIAGGKILRQDFFYRLCSDMILMPPLRRRFKEDPNEMDELLSFTIEKILGTSSRNLNDMVKGAVARHPGRHYTWPGNVREFAQCVRSILLNHRYKSILDPAPGEWEGPGNGFHSRVRKGELDAAGLIRGYCHTLYQTAGTYGEVARITRLDWRTVKKHILEWETKKSGK
ncbi:MAG: sigma-54-dependent Fis family transcriptional regulator [Desulfobacter sp.]|nr:MAG: sigma-54-dependent Fis family transcriptional regulator [Desulfobacter sp.]